MSNINVVIIGEKDWISYPMDAQTIKNSGNNFKVLKTEMIVSELGEIFNTEKRAHHDKESGDCTVPNLIAAYIYRSELYEKNLVNQDKDCTIFYGCFFSGNVDAGRKFVLHYGGLITRAIDNDDELMTTFWSSVFKFQHHWLKEDFHSNSVLNRKLKQFNDAVA